MRILRNRTAYCDGRRRGLW